MTTGMIAVSAESSLLAEASSSASSMSLVPVERRVARRGTVLVGDRRGARQVSSIGVSHDRLPSQVEAVTTYFPNSDLSLGERLDVAGQYWFYATMLTSGFYPTINVWA